MTYAFALEFDKKSAQKIQQKIAQIANPYMVSNKIPPHLTISLFEAEDEDVVKQVFDDTFTIMTKKIIQICNIGKFAPQVIFYSPNKADYLIELNKLSTDKLLNVGIKANKFYLPTSWVPHIALAVQLTSEESSHALKIAAKDFKPFNATIEKVVLVKCNPYQAIAEYVLDV